MLDASVSGREFIVTGEKKIGQHAVKIEVEKARAVIEQIRLDHEHLLERDERFLQLFQQLGLLLAPLTDAATAKLPFLVPEKTQLVGFWDKFLPMNVIQFETRAFHLILNVAPENHLCAAPFLGKQTELKFFAEILGNDLRVFVEFEHHCFPITNDRHLIIAFFGQLPDERTFAVGNVGNFEGSFSEFQNPALDEAERAPRK